MVEQVNVALLGLGTVGTGVWKMVSSNQDLIARRSGKFFDIKGILIRNLNKKRDLPGIQNLLTNRFEDLFKQPIDVVIEAMGGIEPAFTYVKESIQRGCHIVTANKELIARHGVELSQLAKQHGVQILFEASVGGGIPALGTLQHFLKVNRIRKVMGIVNGTTNYILTQMEEKKRSFVDVLSEAQDRGYAEADPSADVDGIDAVHKLAILIRIVFGINVAVEDIFVEGISDVTLSELELASALGYRMKLIAQAEQFGENGPVMASVRPTLLPIVHPLSKIHGVYNAIYIESDQVQDLTLIGQGAGEKPTASAVVEDLVNVYRLPPVYNIYPSKSLLSVGDSSIGENFILLKMSQVCSKKDQVSFIKLVEQFGQVKHWTSEVQGQSTVFALIVNGLEQNWEQSLKEKWKQKIDEMKVRPVMPYGNEVSEEQLPAAHASK